MKTRRFLRYLLGLSENSRALKAIHDTPREVTSKAEADAITARMSS